MDTFQKMVRRSVEFFYVGNDPAHQIGHADQVCNDALRINADHGLGLDTKLIVVAAYYHDIYSGQTEDQRKVHNVEAHDYVLKRKQGVLTCLNDEERVLVAKACLEHRASWKQGWSSLLSECIATADRGAPTADLSGRIARSKRYQIHHFGVDEVEAERMARQHMHDKFGRDGYSVYPPLYRRIYGEKLNHMWDVIDRLVV